MQNKKLTLAAALFFGGFIGAAAMSFMGTGACAQPPTPKPKPNAEQISAETFVAIAYSCGYQDGMTHMAGFAGIDVPKDARAPQNQCAFARALAKGHGFMTDY